METGLGRRCIHSPKCVVEISFAFFFVSFSNMNNGNITANPQLHQCQATIKTQPRLPIGVANNDFSACLCSCRFASEPESTRRHFGYLFKFIQPARDHKIVKEAMNTPKWLQKNSVEAQNLFNQVRKIEQEFQLLGRRFTTEINLSVPDFYVNKVCCFVS